MATAIPASANGKKSAHRPCRGREGAADPLLVSQHLLRVLDPCRADGCYGRRATPFSVRLCASNSRADGVSPASAAGWGARRRQPRRSGGVDVTARYEAGAAWAAPVQADDHPLRSARRHPLHQPADLNLSAHFSPAGRRSARALGRRGGTPGVRLHINWRDPATKKGRPMRWDGEARSPSARAGPSACGNICSMSPYSFVPPPMRPWFF